MKKAPKGLLLHPDTSRQLNALHRSSGSGMLLVGVPEIGKSLIARQLAADLLGVDGGDTSRSSSYLHIETTDKSISIDRVRELSAFCLLKVPGKAEIKRVAVIVDADLLTIPAQNALLKLLEEPPSDTVLLLTSSFSKRLLPTVLSRVQQVHIAAPTSEQVEEYLTPEYSSEEIRQANVVTGGRIGAIIRLLAPSDKTDSSVSLAEVKTILGMDLFSQLLLVEGKFKDKVAAAAFVSVLTQVAAMTTIKLAAAGKPVAQWVGIHRAALCAGDALEKNANPKLAMTELMLTLR